MGWFSAKPQQVPLNLSIQTPNAEPIGAMGFAFVRTRMTPVPILGTGVPSGAYMQEAGPQVVNTLPQNQPLSLNGLYAGTWAYQPLYSPDTVIGAPT